MNYKNSLKNILLPIIITVSVTVGVLIGARMPGDTIQQQISVKPRFNKIGNILSIIESRYVDTVNREELVEAAIPFILNKLDPHSVYIPARDLARMNEPLQGNFEGIGISFNMLTDTVLIISTIPGGPSEKVGILPGDKIIFVGDSLVAGQGIPDDGIIALLKGPRGTEVSIRVLRKGEIDLIPFTMKRDKIPLYSVDVSYMVNDNTGYIKISRFSMTTHREFTEGLEKLKQAGMEKLILDLRGNVGGIMDPSTLIADEFLEEGKLIVYTEGRASPRQEIYSTAQDGFTEGDLVVLIDEFSASASEILAGAIQDNDRGTIIGRRSFGKGLVQEPMPFNDGSAMRLTIARYYTPTGRSIQKPYDNGTEEYYSDLNERLIRGEYTEADSIHFADSLKFRTPGGKTVYGGGGIMPDRFIPADTTGMTAYFMRVRNLGLIYRFALQYTDDNREQLQNFTSPEEISLYLGKEALLNKFIAFAADNGVKTGKRSIAVSGKIIDIQLKAYIARNILDNDGFYPIWQDLDTTLKKAIEYLTEVN
ncbi:MAG: PDZ domain-containing protein [Bacteroidales bacterium]|nr:PDZ domain-containing protein [Bacteroidales bacterium]